MDQSKKQKRARRSFTDEFKAGAVRLVLDEDKTVAQVARDLDLTASALGDWVEQARADRSQGKTGLTTSEREKSSRLRKENRELRMERELLKNRPRGCSHLLNEKLATCYRLRRPEGVAVRFLETPSPLKNMVQGLLRTWQW